MDRPPPALKSLIGPSVLSSSIQPLSTEIPQSLNPGSPILSALSPYVSTSIPVASSAMDMFVTPKYLCSPQLSLISSFIYPTTYLIALPERLKNDPNSPTCPKKKFEFTLKPVSPQSSHLSKWQHLLVVQAQTPGVLLDYYFFLTAHVQSINKFCSTSNVSHPSMSLHLSPHHCLLSHGQPPRPPLHSAASSLTPLQSSPPTMARVIVFQNAYQTVSLSNLKPGSDFGSCLESNASFLLWLTISPKTWSLPLPPPISCPTDPLGTVELFLASRSLQLLFPLTEKSTLHIAGL